MASLQARRFSSRASYRDLSREAGSQLKIRVLDALECAVGGLGAETPARVRAQVEELGLQGRCTLLGGGSAAPDRAALLNGALVRYLDFNDSYLATSRTCSTRSARTSIRSSSRGARSP